MEVAIYAVISGIWWISSATVLLPFLFLLKYNKFLRDRWFSFLFLKFLKPIVGPIVTPIRQKTFDLLNKYLPEQDASSSLNILEIGIGSGANLFYLPENSRLTALDMNPDFETHYLNNQKQYPHIIYERSVIGSAENMNGIDDCSMDIVVSTHVLCSVTNVEACLREIKRVLKPGGIFVFMEHVAFPKYLWSFFVQKMTNPLWKIYCDGCNLTRNIENDIRNAGFEYLICNKIQLKTLVLFFRPHIYGLATK